MVDRVMAISVWNAHNSVIQFEFGVIFDVVTEQPRVRSCYRPLSPFRRHLQPNLPVWDILGQDSLGPLSK